MRTVRITAKEVGIGGKPRFTYVFELPRGNESPLETWDTVEEALREGRRAALADGYEIKVEQEKPT